MWYSNCVLYKQTLLSSLDSRKDRWQGGQYEDCALWYSQYIEHNYRNSWKKPCQKSFDTGRNHGLRLSQEDDEVRLSLSSLTSTSVIDLCLGWSYLPLAIPVYHGISLVIWEIKPKGCVFFCHFRKTKVFWHDAFGCFTVNYCTNYFAVLVGIICFLPKISPVQWQMTLVFRLGGAQKNSAMNWGIGNCGWKQRVFLGLLALLPTLRRTLDDDLPLLFHLFILSRYIGTAKYREGNCHHGTSNEAIGWSSCLLDLQPVGQQGCQTFSFSQEPGAFSVGVSTSQENQRKPEKHKSDGTSGWCLGSFSRWGPGNFGAFVVKLQGFSLQNRLPMLARSLMG